MIEDPRNNTTPATLRDVLAAAWLLRSHKGGSKKAWSIGAYEYADEVLEYMIAARNANVTVSDFKVTTYDEEGNADAE